MTFGERVRFYRKAARLTQADVATAWGKSRPTIANIEADNQDIPASTLPALAAILRVQPATLIGVTNGAEPDLNAIYEAGRQAGRDETRLAVQRAFSTLASPSQEGEV